MYQVTCNATGARYIGISVDPVRRWKTHRKRARQGQSAKLYHALRDHGESAFTFRITHWFDDHTQARKAEKQVLTWGLAELNQTR